MDTTEKPLAVTPVASLMAIISRASTDAAFDVHKLEKLLDVKERWEKDEARKAFVKALSAFKADPPELFKNKEVDYKTSTGKVNYRHASLDHVSNVIGAGLAKHGLSHRWNTVQREDGKIAVTCILMHDDGHREDTTLVAAPDASGSKNPIQAIGSTVSYLQRYTLLSATGTAVQDQDDDGEASGDHKEEKRPDINPKSTDAKPEEKQPGDELPQSYLIDKVSKSTHPGIFYVVINGTRHITSDEKMAKRAFDIFEANKTAEKKTRIDYVSEVRNNEPTLISFDVLKEKFWPQ